MDALDYLQTWEQKFEDEKFLEAFEKKFCFREELISVYWNSEGIKVYYLAGGYQHVTNSFLMRDWKEFLFLGAKKKDLDSFGFPYRIAKVDGRESILIRDYNEDRINLEIEENIVTNVFFG